MVQYIHVPKRKRKALFLVSMLDRLEIQLGKEEAWEVTVCEMMYFDYLGF